jgi:hypothetical protein
VRRPCSNSEKSIRVLLDRELLHIWYCKQYNIGCQLLHQNWWADDVEGNDLFESREGIEECLGGSRLRLVGSLREDTNNKNSESKARTCNPMLVTYITEGSSHKKDKKYVHFALTAFLFTKSTL